MSSQRSSSDVAGETPQARAAHARRRVASRVARARLAIVASAAAVTCGLALFIQSIAPGSSAASAQSSAAGAPQSSFGAGSAQSDGGAGAFDDSGTPGSARASAPSASSGQGDAVSGGS